jgi:hypothetical protein
MVDEHVRQAAADRGFVFDDEDAGFALHDQFCLRLIQAYQFLTSRTCKTFVKTPLRLLPKSVCNHARLLPRLKSHSTEPTSHRRQSWH